MRTITRLSDWRREKMKLNYKILKKSREISENLKEIFNFFFLFYLGYLIEFEGERESEIEKAMIASVKRRILGKTARRRRRKS